MSKVVLAEQQMMLEVGRVTTMRVYVTAAAKRAAVVQEDDLLAKADVQANPDEVSNALYSDLKTWFDNKCFKMQDVAKSSNLMTSRCVCKLKLVKNEKGQMERAIILNL
eukprot:3505578-Pyramimonas_sp.AAC.1